MGIRRLYEINRIGKSLSLNPDVLQRLSSDAQWPGASSRQECCVLTLWLEDFTAAARETLPCAEFIAAFGELKNQAVTFLRQSPAVVTTPFGHCIQAVYSHQISGENFVQSAASTANELVEIINRFRAPGGEHPITSPKIGIALGGAFTGIVKSGSTYEYLVTGKPVTLSRLLSADRTRYGEPVLMDEAAGKRIDLARPLDLYRTPGFTVNHVLYGLQRFPGPTVDKRFKESFIDALGFLYHHPSGEDNTLGKAAQAFERCLSIAPQDDLTQQMIETIRGRSHKGAKVECFQARAFFAV